MENSFEMDYQYLAQQVAYYRSLKETGMTQIKIFERIPEWFIKKVNLDEDYKLDGRILT